MERRSKIENTEVKILSKNDAETSLSAGQAAESMQINESGEPVSNEEEEGEIIFNGYANVILFEEKIVL